MVWSALPALAALIVYLVLAPSVSGDKDASEITLVLALDGVAHPTGYPLYTLLGHLFVRGVHALGATWSYAANAWSALGGAVAVFFLHALAVRLVPPMSKLGKISRFCVGFLPVAVFALDPMWTFETTLAEVYSWHVAWVGATCVLFVEWMRALAAGGVSPRQLRRAACLWGGLLGAGLAHHLTSVFVAAPLTVGLAWSAWRARRLEAAVVVRAALAAVLPLASYGIIAFKALHGGPGQWAVLGPTWSEVIRHVTGAQYHSYMWHYRPSDEQEIFLLRYVYPFLGVGLATLVIAAARPGRDRPVRGALAAAALLATAYGFSYGAQDPSSYFLTPMAIGLAALAIPLAVTNRTAWVRRHAIGVPIVAAVLLGTALVPWIRAAHDRRRVYEQFDHLVHEMWGSIPFGRGFVLWGDDMYARLLEYQQLRGERPDLEIVNPYILAHPRVRERFVARHGFDPVGAVSLKMGPDGTIRGGERALEIYVADIGQRLNQESPLPVVLFDPKQRSVRLLKKPDVQVPEAGGSGSPGGGKPE